MQQVKLFVGVEQELSALESQINEWMRTSGVRVINVSANIAPQTPNPSVGQRAGLGDAGARRFSPSDVFICVTYEAD